MVRHLVFWKFHDEAEGRSAAENLLRVQSALRELPGKIAGIKEFRVCIPEAAGADRAQLCLDSTFEDWAALEKYAVHPEHLKIVQLLSRLRSEKRVADFEI